MFYLWNPMILSNYRTIMIAHYLAKLYGSILESEVYGHRGIVVIQLDRQAFRRASQLWITY